MESLSFEIEVSVIKQPSGRWSFRAMDKSSGEWIVDLNIFEGADMLSARHLVADTVAEFLKQRLFEDYKTISDKRS